MTRHETFSVRNIDVEMLASRPAMYSYTGSESHGDLMRLAFLEQLLSLLLESSQKAARSSGGLKSFNTSSPGSQVPLDLSLVRALCVTAENRGGRTALPHMVTAAFDTLIVDTQKAVAVDGAGRKGLLTAMQRFNGVLYGQFTLSGRDPVLSLTPEGRKNFLRTFGENAASVHVPGYGL